MFQRKVHPERTASAQNFRNISRFEIKNLPKDMMNMNGKHAQEATKRSMHGQSLSTMNENGECWIRTDADCEFEIPFHSHFLESSIIKKSKACATINFVFTFI